MKIDLNVKLKDLDDKPIKNRLATGRTDEKGFPILKDGDDLLLKEICTTALLGNYDEKIDGNEKVRRFKLATEIHGSNGEVDLQAEEISLIKNLISKSFSVLITGQAWQLLDPIKEKMKRAVACLDTELDI